MYVVMNRIPVNPLYNETFEERFRDRAKAVDDMPGFIRNQVLRPTEDGQPYVVLTMWESREAFEAWTKSDAFKKGHAKSGSLPEEAFPARNVLEKFEVFADSDTRREG